MVAAELQELEEVKNLVSKGQAEGVIAYGDVATALREVDVDEGDIEELYGFIESQGSSAATSTQSRRWSSRTSASSSRSPRTTATRASLSSI
jgi:hypothetical protein